jgi:hypothetical protein
MLVVFVEVESFREHEGAATTQYIWCENSVVGMATLLTSPLDFPTSPRLELFTRPFTRQREAGGLATDRGSLTLIGVLEGGTAGLCKSESATIQYSTRYSLFWTELQLVISRVNTVHARRPTHRGGRSFSTYIPLLHKHLHA